MGRIVYVNGDFVPEEEARVSVFDRGFLFADGIYEVTSVLEGKLIDFPGHLRRMHRSLGELDIPVPIGDAELESLHRELVARNGKVVKITHGATHVVRPEFDPGIERELRRYFDRYHTMRLDHFKVADDEIAEGGKGRVITHPCRRERSA